MSSAIQSIVAAGSKIWLDSIDPELVRKNLAEGATGATSNPIIISDLIKTGRFDDDLAGYLNEGLDDEAAAWALNDQMVRDQQKVFGPIWERTGGDDGYVSFELDPLLEDPQLNLSPKQRVARYVALGRKWYAGHTNRLIKVPATAAGIEALEELAAAGVKLNVTLIFTFDQYLACRQAVWRGMQRYGKLDGYKSVYSIFISRVDVYTAKHVPQLSAGAQGMVGLVNAKRMYKANREFWADKGLKLSQEMIFASTGTKLASDPADKYVAALVGSDIMTNPPQTNEAVQAGGKTYKRTVDDMPSPQVLADIDKHVDVGHMHDTLMSEGIAKFADPQKALIKLVGQKRRALLATG
ncbi:MAG: transaldolase [Phycisphaeraceae bacterium]|nr:transaldolase [Phycisphaeraceae bacterium]